MPPIRHRGSGRWSRMPTLGGRWVDTMYLANSASCVLGPNGSCTESLTLVIDYGGAVPDDFTTNSVPVQVLYQRIHTASGTSIQGSTPPQSLSLMANEGAPMPLVASFVGPATVLNDGTTVCDLTLRMANTSLDPMQFIVPINGQPTQRYIEVALPVSDAPGDAVWALSGTAAANAIQASLSGSEANGWSVSAGTTQPGLLVLRPDYTQLTAIPALGTIDLLLTGVSSALAPELVQVQLSVNRFALYGTQTLGLPLKKSPLVYNGGLGAGMTLSGGILGANTAWP